MHLRYIDGSSKFSAEDFSFISDNARDIAAWKAGLNFLVDNQLVIDMTQKGEIFELTKTGWELSDTFY